MSKDQVQCQCGTYFMQDYRIEVVEKIIIIFLLKQKYNNYLKNIVDVLKLIL